MAAIPYPGLRTFKSSESALFFGQDDNADELFSILGQRHFVAVVGESGCGKSSLVRAGLVPLLLPEWSRPRPSWEVIFTQPGMSPVANLARSLSKSPHLAVQDVGRLEAEMRDDEQAIVRLLETSRASGEAMRIAAKAGLGIDAGHGVLVLPPSQGLYETGAGTPAPADADGAGPAGASPKHLLIVADQFEELFRFRREGTASQHRDDEAAVYVKLLLNAAQKQTADIFVVLTMRAEYLGDSAQFYNLAEAINSGLFLLPRMNRVQCQKAIVEPPQTLGYSLPSALVQRLLNESEERADGLPLLQHGLRYLWDVTSEEHRRLGIFPLPEKFSQEKAKDLIGWSFDEHLDTVYGGLNEQQKAIARRIFKLLGERDPRGLPVRRPTKWSEIRAIGPDDQTVMDVLDCFRDEEGGRTFLVPSKQKTPQLKDTDKVDLSHEVLLRQWSNYTTWLNEEQEDSGNYIWLADAAYREKRGDVETLQGLELRALVKWRDEFSPSETWAGRYSGPVDPKLKLPRRNYADAMAFLKKSEKIAAEELAREKALEELEKKKLRRRLFASWLSFITIFVLILIAAYLKIHSVYDLGKQKAEDTAKIALANQEREEQAKESKQRQQALERETEAKQIISALELAQKEELTRQLTDQRNHLLAENLLAVKEKADLLKASEQKNVELTETEGQLRKANDDLRTDKLVDDMRLKYAKLESTAENSRFNPVADAQGASAMSALRDLSSLDPDLTPRLAKDRLRVSDAVLSLLSSALTKKLLLSQTYVTNLQQVGAALNPRGEVLSFGILSEESFLPHVAALQHGLSIAANTITLRRASGPFEEIDAMEVSPGEYVLIALRKELLGNRSLPAREAKALANAISADGTLVVIGNEHGWIQVSRPLTPEEASSRHFIAQMKSLFRLHLGRDSVSYVQFDQSGKYIITRSENQRFHVIDVPARKIVGSGESRAAIVSADVSPDGRLLAIATLSDTLVWHRGADGEFAPVSDKLRLQFSGQADKFFSGGAEQFLDNHRVFRIFRPGICDTADLELALHSSSPEIYKTISCSFPVTAMAVGQKGVVAVTDGSNVELIDANENKSLAWLELQPSAGADPISKLVFSSDGSKLLVLRGDKRIQLLNASELQKADSLAQLTAAVHAMRTSTDKPRTAEALKALLDRSRAFLPERN